MIKGHCISTLTSIHELSDAIANYSDNSVKIAIIIRWIVVWLYYYLDRSCCCYCCTLAALFLSVFFDNFSSMGRFPWPNDVKNIKHLAVMGFSFCLLQRPLQQAISSALRITFLPRTVKKKANEKGEHVSKREEKSQNWLKINSVCTPPKLQGTPLIKKKTQRKSKITMKWNEFLLQLLNIC